jgi:2-dehydropantoate 2-reductase
MNIVVFGAGVEGTIYGVRFSRAGHKVTLVAREQRAAELRARGAHVRDARSGRSDIVHLPVVEKLAPDTHADLCFVFVRREQLDTVIPDLQAASRIGRFVFMVNHANGSDRIFSALGRKRVVLGFPSAAGEIENGVDVYVDLVEQPTVIERNAPDVAAVIREAGFRVTLARDVDSWLKRHAVFVTAVGGAILKKNGDALLLSADKELVRTFILAVREGWSALDRIGVGPATLALRTIFCWVPLPMAVAYWRRLFGSDRGEYYFARHTRHAPAEMRALVADVRLVIRGAPTPHLQLLYAAVDGRCGESIPGKKQDA